MVSLGKDASKAFNYLKTKKPGEEIRVRDESGRERQVVYVRRGRQNARVRDKEDEILLLIPLEDIIVPN